MYWWKLPHTHTHTHREAHTNNHTHICNHTLSSKERVAAAQQRQTERLRQTKRQTGMSPHCLPGSPYLILSATTTTPATNVQCTQSGSQLAGRHCTKLNSSNNNNNNKNGYKTQNRKKKTQHQLTIIKQSTSQPPSHRLASQPASQPTSQSAVGAIGDPAS